MKVLKTSNIIVECNGCGSVFEFHAKELVVCGFGNNNTGITCPVCGKFNMVSQNGEFNNNVKIFNDECN